MNDSSKKLKENIGLRVQTIRKKLHMNQEELAKQLKVSNGTISAIEKGNIFPSFKVIYYLAKSFNVNLLFLFIRYRRNVQPGPGKAIVNPGFSWRPGTFPGKFYPGFHTIRTVQAFYYGILQKIPPQIRKIDAKGNQTG